MTAGGVERLASLVASCAAAGVARQALLLRLGRLPPAFQRPHHLRLAEAALEPLLRLPRAELFELPGPSLAVVWRGAAEAEVLDVIDGLEHLLADPAGTAPELPDLISLYDLPDTGDLLLQAFAAAPDMAEVATAPTRPLDPAFLTLLEGCLAQADLARFARRRSVWQMDGSAAPQLAWEDRLLSMRELTDALAPGYDLQAEPWLFRRLTRTLDRRVLALLASPGELAVAGPFAMDLNIGSLLSADFLRFDAALPAGLRGRVVLALSPADLVADARSVRFATGFARERGYRLLLRLDTAELLGALTPAADGFDYTALPWDGTLPGREGTVLAPPAPDRLVLTGCDDGAALEWGLARGIRLFTGMAADQVQAGRNWGGSLVSLGAPA